jgi:hypothetical protein
MAGLRRLGSEGGLRHRDLRAHLRLSQGFFCTISAPALRAGPTLFRCIIVHTNLGKSTHGLDNPDPRRDLHRPRNQWLPAGRVLIPTHLQDTRSFVPEIEKGIAKPNHSLILP